MSAIPWNFEGQPIPPFVYVFISVGLGVVGYFLCRTYRRRGYAIISDDESEHSDGSDHSHGPTIWDDVLLSPDSDE
jgi:hypothetical protein